MCREKMTNWAMTFIGIYLSSCSYFIHFCSLICSICDMRRCFGKFQAFRKFRGLNICKPFCVAASCSVMYIFEYR